MNSKKVKEAGTNYIDPATRPQGNFAEAIDSLSNSIRVLNDAVHELWANKLSYIVSESARSAIEPRIESMVNGTLAEAHPNAFEFNSLTNSLYYAYNRLYSVYLAVYQISDTAYHFGINPAMADGYEVAPEPAQLEVMTTLDMLECIHNLLERGEWSAETLKDVFDGILAYVEDPCDEGMGKRAGGTSKLQDAILDVSDRVMGKALAIRALTANIDL